MLPRGLDKAMTEERNHKLSEYISSLVKSDFCPTKCSQDQFERCAKPCPQAMAFATKSWPYLCHFSASLN